MSSSPRLTSVSRKSDMFRSSRMVDMTDLCELCEKPINGGLYCKSCLRKIARTPHYIPKD